MVQRVIGDVACVYLALDGTKLEIPLSDVVPVDAATVSALESQRELRAFKLAVAEGGRVYDAKLDGRSLALMALGVTDGFVAPTKLLTAGQLRAQSDPATANQAKIRGLPVAEEKTEEAEEEDPEDAPRGTDVAPAGATSLTSRTGPTRRAGSGRRPPR